MRQYNLVEGGDAATGGIGVMTDGRWKAFAEMAIAQGVYSKDLDYTKAYTLDFVRPAGK
jgi:NitT/TauT family transport system substrate-binding protein